MRNFCFAMKTRRCRAAIARQVAIGYEIIPLRPLRRKLKHARPRLLPW